jgi:hypothetical protein
MRQILSKLGFIRIHQCNCGGPLEFWQHPDVPSAEVDIRPDRGSFDLWIGGKGTKGTHTVGTEDVLEQKLKEFLKEGRR